MNSEVAREELVAIGKSESCRSWLGLDLSRDLLGPPAWHYVYAALETAGACAGFEKEYLLFVRKHYRNQPLHLLQIESPTVKPVYFLSPTANMSITVLSLHASRF